MSQDERESSRGRQAMAPALKILHQPSPSEVERERAPRELRLIASVFHPSVVQFKDHGWHEGRLWFVMPWYEGETLEDRMEREPLTRDEARAIFEPLARALASMHARGIRHQDIKPENIFLATLPGDSAPLPVLLDLGVAAEDAEQVFAGTPTYFAPEVACQFASVEEKPPVGHAADVFALALALRNALEPSTQEDVPSNAVETFIEARARAVPALPRNPQLRFLEPWFARWMALEPPQILMVACHNFDLNAAHEAGLRTAFVARPDEWGPAGPPDPQPNMAYDHVVEGFAALCDQVLSTD